MSSNVNSSATPSPSELLTEPQQHLTKCQSQWVQPLSFLSRAGQAVLFHTNRRVVRLVFRLSLDGTQHIPKEDQFILAPNHTSSLDPCVIAAALTLEQFRSLRWAARRGVVTGGFFREAFARLARALPIRRSIHSLAAASVVLKRGENLVWFPEGTRSQDGELQPLKRGIGYLACHHGVAVVPVMINGAHDAMPPPRKRLRKISQISVRFGKPLIPKCESGIEADSSHVTEELSARLHELA